MAKDISFQTSRLVWHMTHPAWRAAYVGSGEADLVAAANLAVTEKDPDIMIKAGNRWAMDHNLPPVVKLTGGDQVES